MPVFQMIARHDNRENLVLPLKWFPLPQKLATELCHDAFRYDILYHFFIHNEFQYGGRILKFLWLIYSCEIDYDTLGFRLQTSLLFTNCKQNTRQENALLIVGFNVMKMRRKRERNVYTSTQWRRLKTVVCKFK